VLGVKPPEEVYVLFPLTLAVPTWVQATPVHVPGAVVEGPLSKNVSVPVALEPDEFANAEVMELALMAVPTVPVPGASELTVGDALPTTVLVILGLLHRLAAALLLPSVSLKDAYHQ
jgi:hypothetical protein